MKTLKSYTGTFIILILCAVAPANTHCQTQVNIILHQPPPNQLSSGDFMENNLRQPVQNRNLMFNVSSTARIMNLFNFDMRLEKQDL